MTLFQFSKKNNSTKFKEPGVKIYPELKWQENWVAFIIMKFLLVSVAMTQPEGKKLLAIEVTF